MRPTFAWRSSERLERFGDDRKGEESRSSQTLERFGNDRKSEEIAMPEPVQYRGMALVVPDNDSEWKEFYAAARQHRLVMRACGACRLMRYPPSHACPWCTSREWSWREVSGRGAIVSYELVTHAIQPGFKDWTPYAVVLVELDEQRGQPTPDEALRVIANLVTADGGPEAEEQVAIGKRVRAVFQDLSPHLALPQFALLDEPPVGRVWRFPG